MAPRTTGVGFFRSCRYSRINSGFMSPRTAFGGAIAKNRHPEPTNGSKYVPYCCGAFSKSCGTRRNLLPAHLITGFLHAKFFIDQKTLKRRISTAIHLPLFFKKTEKCRLGAGTPPGQGGAADAVGPAEAAAGRSRCRLWKPFFSLSICKNLRCLSGIGTCRSSKGNCFFGKRRWFWAVGTCRKRPRRGGLGKRGWFLGGGTCRGLNRRCLFGKGVVFHRPGRAGTRA